MLGRILRAALIQQMQHFMLQGHAVVPFFHDIVLVEYVAHEMAVIQFMADFTVDLLRQLFKPIAIVAPQGDIERNDVFHFFIVHRAVAYRGGSHRETVQHRRLGFFRTAFEIRTAVAGKIIFQIGPRLFYALPAHFQNQVVFIAVAIVAQALRQVFGQQFAESLQSLVGKMFR